LKAKVKNSCCCC